MSTATAPAPLPHCARPIRHAGRVCRVTHRERKIAAGWLRVWKRYGLTLADARAKLFARFA